MRPTLREEKKLWKRGYKRVVGLDEAGMGPLAGPVVAAAVLVNQKSKVKNQNDKSKIKDLLREINDSKKLAPRKREEFYKILTTHPDIKWGVGIVSEKTIDRINILQASHLAMKKALAQLEKNYRIYSRINYRIKSGRGRKRAVHFIILDGRGHLDVPVPQRAIVKADEKVFSCAAASIIAKVTRDRIMTRLHKKYPQYGFDKHKGYPTKLHRKMIRKYGQSRVHRESFNLVGR